MINLGFKELIMKPFIRIIVLFSLILIISGCVYKDNPDAHRHINFVNNSELDVYVSHSPWGPNDTLCYDIMQTHNNSQITKVNARSTSDSPLYLGRYRNDTWENYLNNSLGTVIIFVHNAVKSDSICSDRDVNWNYMDEDEKERLYSFLNSQIILKRYYCTLKDLENLDWTITYP